MKKIALLIFVFIPLAFSLNLGSFIKNDFIEIKQNETAVFEIVLWSTDQNYNIIVQEKNTPENIRIRIEPKVIDKNKDEIYIAKENTLIKAHRVKIFVESYNAKPGDYVFSVSALSYNPEEKINVIQEREFHFRVRVIGDYADIKSTFNKINESQYSSKIFEETREKTYKKIIILSAIILTIIIVILIIKI